MSAKTATGDATAAMAKLRAEGLTCTRCDLYKTGTPVVWGEGDPEAKVVFIGQGPGEQESKQERPFIGPAGRLFDRALAEAGIDRAKLWLTNGIKHWATTTNARGNRVNRPPRVGEMRACHLWLEGELAIVQPRLIVCLGASAVQALTGKAATMGDIRGKWTDGPDDAAMMATFHPSYLLRLQGADEAAAAATWDIFLADLGTVRDRAKELGLAI
jgi:uracil-DNA glycosylase